VYEDWSANLLVVVLTLVAVAASVLLHYEGLQAMARRLPRLHESDRRRKVLYGISGVLALHIAEIWIFGLAIRLAQAMPGAGGIHGVDAAGLFDAIYLSAVTYTTVGFGDVAPVGPLRFLAGTEALTGFVLITWSASFTYLEMQRYWKA
jgi:hypothetical protein